MPKCKYNLTYEDYANMLKAQNNSCAICKRGSDKSGKQINLAVDHNHTTGATRGLLCTKCNFGIKHFLDDVGIVESAAAYLENPPAFNDSYWDVSMYKSRPTIIVDQHARHIKRKYDITTTQEEQFKVAQFDKCAICNIKTELMIDSCHSSIRIRGMLCKNCSDGLGSFGDDTYKIKETVVYLKSYK